MLGTDKCARVFQDTNNHDEVKRRPNRKVFERSGDDVDVVESGAPDGGSPCPLEVPFDSGDACPPFTEPSRERARSGADLENSFARGDSDWPKKVGPKRREMVFGGPIPDPRSEFIRAIGTVGTIEEILEYCIL
jgi:hypothetical protein